jgi:probable rRNA maturation factor
MHRVTVQFIVPKKIMPLPTKLKNWAKAALAFHSDPAEITLRIVDQTEMTDLNSRYRHKNGPTNVLSFPYEEDPLEKSARRYLGDIVICADIVNSEANAQHKTLDAHWAHMVVHGSLHLLGYDHVNEADAIIMEKQEIDILNTLGFANPYIGEQ